MRRTCKWVGSALLAMCTITVLLLLRVTPSFQTAHDAAAEHTNSLPPPPKVALLFLSRGAIATAPVWHEWFATAALIEPTHRALQGLPPDVWQPTAHTAGQHVPSSDTIAAAAGTTGPEEQGDSSLDRSEAFPGGETQPGISAVGRAARKLLQNMQRNLRRLVSRDGSGIATGGLGNTQDIAASEQGTGSVHNAVYSSSSSRISTDSIQSSGDGLDSRQAKRRLWEVPQTVKRVTHRPAYAGTTAAAGSRAGEEAVHALQSPFPWVMEKRDLGNCSDLTAEEDNPIARQQLFSVYVHVAQDYEYCEGDLFAPYAVPVEERVVVHWGQHSMVDAERALLAAALREPLNQRFVMLSDSCAPLYPPQVIWLQALWERQSRVNACKGPGDEGQRGEGRWQDAMETEMLKKDHWRKSSQWASFTRAHVQLVAQDTDVVESFRWQCYTFWPDIDPAMLPTWLNYTDLDRRQCISDEHYIPTLLAVHGLDEQTDCLGALTHTEWKKNSWSPKKYRPMQVTFSLVSRLRRAWFTHSQCGVRPALDSANSMFQLRTPETHPTPENTHPDPQHAHVTQTIQEHRNHTLAAQQAALAALTAAADSVNGGTQHSYTAQHSAVDSAGQGGTDLRGGAPIGPPGTKQGTHRNALRVRLRRDKLGGRTRDKGLGKGPPRGPGAWRRAAREIEALQGVPQEDLTARVYDEYQPLDHACSLFARKFDGKAAGPLLRLAEDCDYGLAFARGCVTEARPVVPKSEGVARYQKEMLRFLQLLSNAKTTKPVQGHGKPHEEHSSHGGPQATDDTPDLDYWHEHSLTHQLPLPPEMRPGGELYNLSGQHDVFTTLHQQHYSSNVTSRTFRKRP